MNFFTQSVGKYLTGSGLYIGAPVGAWRTEQAGSDVFLSVKGNWRSITLGVVGDDTNRLNFLAAPQQWYAAKDVTYNGSNWVAQSAYPSMLVFAGAGTWGFHFYTNEGVTPGIYSPTVRVSIGTRTDNVDNLVVGGASDSAVIARFLGRVRSSGSAAGFWMGDNDFLGRYDTNQVGFYCDGWRWVIHRGTGTIASICPMNINTGGLESLPAQVKGLRVIANTTHTSSWAMLWSGSTVWSPSADCSSGAEHYGLDFIAQTNTSYDMSLAGTILYGTRIICDHQTPNSKTLNTLSASTIYARSTSSGGTVANLYGIRLFCGATTAGSFVGSCMAVYIASNSRTGTITNSFAIYQEGTSDLNYFGGRICQGNGAPDVFVTSCELYNSTTNTVNDQYALRVRQFSNPSGATANAIYGAIILGASGYGNAQTHAAILGVVVQCHHQGTATCSSGVGLRVYTTKNNTGQFTDTACLHTVIENSNASGIISTATHLFLGTPSTTGNITTVYGLRVLAQKTAQITTAYSIYQAGASDLNYLAGATSIGAALTTGEMLTVAGLASFAHYYGFMSQYDVGTVVTVSATSTFYDIAAGWTGGSTNGFTFQNSKELKCLRAGKYMCHWSISITCAAANQEIEAGITKGGAIDTSTTEHQKVLTGADTVNISGCGVLTLAVNDLLRVAVSNETGTNNITVQHSQLAVHMVDYQ